MADNSQAKPKKDMGKILGFAFIGLNLATLGAGAYLVYASTLGVQAKELSNAQAERELATFEDSLRGDPVLYTMTPFNTNLDGVPRRLIRLELSLEMMDEEGFEEVIGITPQARDSIMRILNGKTYEDVETVQGKLQLKNQIVADLNGSLKKGVVKNVYFNELVVQ
ncbi:MAG TPA: flagellar basal body-associated FliL family protein [Bdellovibrionales bacterium]|nr:flagellar basal body-associated FliL family protein [Bdellovibrionales bacterium]